jgi:WhiB family redox-sensing transcriptional regulator
MSASMKPSPRGHPPYEGKSCWPCYKQQRREAEREPEPRAKTRGEPAELVLDDDWREEAACRYPADGLDADDWFNDKRWTPEVTQRAQAVCSECPVREACLAYALDTRQPYGVWGGHTPAERGVTRPQQRAG